MRSLVREVLPWIWIVPALGACGFMSGFNKAKECTDLIARVNKADSELKMIETPKDNPRKNCSGEM